MSAPLHTHTAAQVLAGRQADIFEAAPEDFELTAPAVKLDRDGWHACAWSLGRASAWVNPREPGVVVKHCGHPTALRPYYIEGLPISRKFCTLIEAKNACRTPAAFIAETAAWEAAK